MSNDQQDGSGDDSRYTRRGVMQTGGAVATTALLSKFSTGVSRAQSTGTEPRIALGSEWEIDDVANGDGTVDLALRHSSGAELLYDTSEGVWTVGSLEATTDVSTPSLTDSADGGEWETLKLAGYSVGDIVTRATFGGTGASNSTTSTSYVYATNICDIKMMWDQVFPAGTDTYAQLSTYLNPGSGETAYAQLYNDTDGEAITSVSGSGSGTYSSGWVQYTPPTKSGEVRYDARIRTDPGTNSSTVEEYTVLFGVKL